NANTTGPFNLMRLQINQGTVLLNAPANQQIVVDRDVLIYGQSALVLQGAAINQITDNNQVVFDSGQGTTNGAGTFDLNGHSGEVIGPLNSASTDSVVTNTAAGTTATLVVGGRPAFNDAPTGDYAGIVQDGAG